MRSNVRFIPPVSIPGFCVHPARQALFVNRPSGHLSAFRFFVALVNIPVFRHLSTFRFLGTCQHSGFLLTNLICWGILLRVFFELKTAGCTVPEELPRTYS
jgi:hypothetical protein